jgi:hypothetical protein
MKKAHLNELISVSTREGNHKVNPMDTLPKFTPGEGHYEGSLVQKFYHEVPVEFEDQYFQLMFTDEMLQILLYLLFIFIALCLLTCLACLLTSPSFSPPFIILSSFQLLVDIVKVLTSYFLNDALLI